MLPNWGRFAVALAAGLFALTLSAVAGPPRLASAAPDGADAVDAAACREIVLTFDQPMSTTGQSICGGGPSFPPFDGKPAWRDGRTFVIPVKLEPGHAYSFSVNCPAAQNFRSAMGAPALIHPISFRTLAEGEAAPTLAPADAKQATEALENAFMSRYSYRTRLADIDWPAEFKAARPGLEAATTPAMFARAAATLLARARDPHISVRVGETFIPTFRRNVPLNFDAKRVEASLEKLTKHNNTVWTGTFNDGIGYILIAGWPGGPGADQQLAPALEAITTFANAPGLIVDVRPNGGGDELSARRVASRFVSEPTDYSWNDIVDPSQPGGFTPRIARRLEPAPASDGPKVACRVAVLIGPACLSSNESFIAMMRPSAARPGADLGALSRVLVGDTTGGSSGNPKPHDLGIGVTVTLPSWRDFTMDGTMLEGRGITPDVAVVWSPGMGVAKGDPVIDAALMWLRKDAKK